VVGLTWYAALAYANVSVRPRPCCRWGRQPASRGMLRARSTCGARSALRARLPLVRQQVVDIRRGAEAAEYVG
jgi:hypothetical protein